MVDVGQDIAHAPTSPPSTVELVQQQQTAGNPVTLLVNGKAELVVDDATSYQMLLDLVERLETIAAIRTSMRQIDEGQGVSLEQAKDEVRQRYLCRSP